ncbi:hypothetical protein C6N75_02605 [Streptomyces solincola]|uniref:DUF4190 domain-containing protein n=1 Tax=Streptomyces solincola TaxID=2100817 RepID=A0A2S9Q276_9ACTN|nr:DUF4190 domain-containing protein [Streptomyces solincola]PRH80738.1 hypothetical protein C6N75_02605 [Streptomyces solincola]
MSDKRDPHDPWAPPEGGTPRERPADPPATPPPGVHDFPTVTSLPGADGEVPPPPLAPGGPSPTMPGGYGHGYPDPAAPPGGYGYPDPAATSGGYGRPDLTATSAGYGYPPAPAPGPGYPGYPGYGAWGSGGQSNGMGITAMVLGIVAVVMFCAWGLGVLLGILALIFGIIGRNKAKRGEANNGGMALAGVILGSVAIAAGAAFLAFLVWAVNQDGGDGSDPDPYPYGSALSQPAAAPR